MAEAPPTRPSLLMRVRDAADEAAWAQFVPLYAPLIYGYARKSGLQDAAACGWNALRGSRAAQPLPDSLPKPAGA